MAEGISRFCFKCPPPDDGPAGPQIQSLTLRLDRGDNQIVVLLNGKEIYNKSTEGDPSLNKIIDLVHRLQYGRNILSVVGANWSGPSHFVGTLLQDGDEVDGFDESKSAPGNGIVFTWFREIIVSPPGSM